MSRPFRKILAWIVLLCGIVNGCVTPIGGARFPEPTATFQPHREFSLSYNALWERMERVLDTNRIRIASGDKHSGRIVTDYITGQTQMTALALLGVIATRYKYTIRLERLDQQQTRVNINCILESSGDAMPAWRDVSSSNPAVVTRLEHWLYEQIQQARE